MNPIIKKKKIYFSFTKLKSNLKKYFPKNEEIKADKIEELGRKNINLVLNNPKKTMSKIFELYFDYKIEEKTIKEQYCYMRSLYSFLIKMLLNYRIIIKQDDIPIIILDEKNDFIINENSDGNITFGSNLEKEKSFALNSNSFIKTEKTNSIMKLNEEINLEIERDEKYHLICQSFDKYWNNKIVQNLNKIKNALGKKKFLEYENFVNDKKIKEIIIYNTENYSIILSRKNKRQHLTLKKLEYIND